MPPPCPESLAEFVWHPSRIGAPTAIHTESGVWIHSRVDPVTEAHTVAKAYLSEIRPKILLIGGGLGYLPEAMLELSDVDLVLTVIEPHPNLFRLAQRVRPDSVYAKSSRVQVISAPTAGTLAHRIRELQTESTVQWSPYLSMLCRRATDPIARMILTLHTERVSAAHYADQLSRNVAANAGQFSHLSGARLCSGKAAVVSGAGPSLDLVCETLRDHRESFVLVAVSGAVPALLSQKLVPDWVIAFEAREAIVRDLESLPHTVKVIVFPFTNPGILLSDKWELFSGSCAGRELLTRGGTSLVPALDFALQSDVPFVYLCGADLGAGSSAYARHSLRENITTTGMMPSPPKFEAMRAGLESAIERRKRPGLTIHHVLDRGRTLRGTIRLPTSELAINLLQHQLVLHEPFCNR